MQRRLQANEKGLSLIELLAALVIFGMVASILYSFLLMGISMYKRVTVETQMRNQGDTLYSQIISELKDAIYVQQAGTDKMIRYAKSNPSTYIDLYEMELVPNETAGGKIVVRQAGNATPIRSFELSSRFTISDGSLNEASSSHDRVQVRLTYTRANAEGLKAAERPELEIDSQIPLIRNE
ncbi:type II secretion system protein [Paenibacillus koleovorans]|uniref:type II secretion system protein n=1 Tax=Paenibacillus koleovorans TaxID=121608 RepID=UPI000FDA87EA|nr:prepilin-type N-terminal cleavage/methylation domain-containing protein [Paenibacillus koleovorans]